MFTDRIENKIYALRLTLRTTEELLRNPFGPLYYLFFFLLLRKSYIGLLNDYLKY